MLKIFIGYDERQPIAYNVLQSSIARHSSRPVAIIPLILKQLPIRRRGLTSFTYTRFLVPYLCGFRGRALFLDADMVVTGDIADLFSWGDLKFSVAVNREQPQFEWASAMLFNCEHCQELTPAYIEDTGKPCFDLAWADHGVAAFPMEWNHCVGYVPVESARLYHYTAGIPCWEETRGHPADVHWEKEHKVMNSTVRWQELMGNSVHAADTLKRMAERKTPC